MVERWMSIGPIECLFLGFIVAAVLAVVLVGAFLLTRAGRTTANTGPVPRETSLEVLRRRLAAGEITPEQFDELRRRLEE